MGKRLICILLLWALFLPAAVAVENASGATDEVVYEDPEAGIYRYESPALKIEAIRRYDEKKKLTWTVVEVISKGQDVFHVIPANPDKPMELHALKYVEQIAAENGTVLGLSTDFAFSRIKKNQVAGVVIRNREVYSTKTRKKTSNTFPNLDTLALFPDGDMKVFENNEKTADDFLAMGAMDVLAFGPVLIADGIMNEEDLARYGVYREPRIGIGMYEKGHYLIIMTEGRHSKSKGTTLAQLAQLFADEGCPLAFNLDGGQTASLSFMGKQIIQVGKSEKVGSHARRTNEILGIGYSPQVKQKE